MDFLNKEHPTQPLQPFELEHFLNYVRIAWRHRKLITLSLVVGVMIGVGYLKNTSRVYESREHIVINPSTWADADSQSSAVLTDPAKLLEQEVIKSRSNAVLVRTLHLLQTRQGTSEALAQWSLADLRGALSISTEPSSNAIVIAGRASTPDQAAMLVNLFVRACIDEHQASQIASADQCIEHLNLMLNQASTELNPRIREAEYLEENFSTIITTSSSSPLATQNMASLTDALIKARQQTLEYKLAMEVIPLNSPHVEDVTSAITNTLSMQLPDEEKELSLLATWRSQLLQQRQQAVQLLGDAHPAVLEISRHIDELKAAMDNRSRLIAADVARRYHNALAREGNIQKSYEQYARVLASLSSVSSRYHANEAEVRRLKEVVQSLQARIDRVRSWKELCPPSAIALDPDQSDPLLLRPFFPIVVSMALVYSAAFSAATIAVAEVVNRKVWSLREASHALRLSFCLEIPKPAKAKSPRSGSAKSKHLAGVVDLEPYRRLAASFLHKTSLIDARSILMTSPRDAEGKSTLIANLAVACALTGRRILLIDTDPRSSPLETLLDSNGARRSHTDPNQENPEDCSVRRSAVKGLDLLMCGAAYARDSSLFNGPSFQALLQKSKADYDLVLIDSASLESSSDALLISTAADLTLMLMTIGSTRVKEAQRARDQLLGVGARVGGMIACFSRAAEQYRLNPGCDHPKTVPAAEWRGAPVPDRLRIAM